MERLFRFAGLSRDVLARWRPWILVLWTGLIGLTVAGSMVKSMMPPSAHEMDKVVHASVYALLAAVVPLITRRLSWQMIGLGGLVLLGGGIEILQSMVPGRDASLFDFGADCIGIAVGWVIARQVLRSLLSR